MLRGINRQAATKRKRLVTVVELLHNEWPFVPVVVNQANVSFSYWPPSTIICNRLYCGKQGITSSTSKLPAKQIRLDDVINERKRLVDVTWVLIETRGLSPRILEKNSGTVPELDWETTAMIGEVGGGFER